MSDYCVVVADSSRARFFTLESSEVPGVESGPNLVEHKDMDNPEAPAPGRETWTDAKSGRNTARGGGPAHGYDDHRDNHEEEFNRRFAKHIAERAVEVARQHNARCLVLVAANRMLGLLRENLAIPPGAKIDVRETAKDLVRLNANEIHEHLGGAGLVPARKRVTT